MADKRHKHGDIREDGMVFWGRGKNYANGEYWVLPEKFAEMREKQAARKRTPEYLETQAAYRRTPEFLKKRAAYRRTPEYRGRNADRVRNLRANDSIFATSMRLRCRTREAFRRIAADKPASTQELLGTDWQTLKAHIESQFVDGMGWENMSDWHIDHIIPLASAKTEEELAALCHYTNLQPLWASDNLSKGAKLP